MNKFADAKRERLRIRNLSVVIGRLRHRLTIQYPDEDTLDSQGNPIVTWTELDIVWGSIEPVRGRELYEIKQVQTEITHKIIIRYYADLLTKYRIIFGERIFNIDSIINVQERNIFLEIMAIEKI